MMRALVASAWGLLFGLGLGIGGFARPTVIQGAMDFAGDWNPALFITVTVAVIVYQVAYRLILRRRQPLFAPTFALPRQTRVDAKLVAGSAIFGAGWGLAGMCPGATLVALAGGDPRALWFMGAVVVGIAASSRGSVARLGGRARLAM